MSRIRPKAVAQELVAFAHETSSFWMHGKCMTSGGITDIFVPAHFAKCADSVTVNGSATLQVVHVEGDGTQVVKLECEGGGDFYASCNLDT